MEEIYISNFPGVKKMILAGGSGPLPHFPPGTKLVFHFQTLLDNFERTVIDDSRLVGRPAEIFVGKMFKMEVWETLLMSMRIGEVAEFYCDATHTGLYPIVSKGMRLIAQGKDPLEGQRHMCGMGNMLHYHSTGFQELDELMRTPQPLIFIMELLQVGDPMSYHRESWMMEKDEKLQTVPVLHMQGNALVKQRRFTEASSKYKEAVLLLKTVQSKEMPGDVDYINLGRMMVPLELNYCQCMLELEEYYEVIEHTTELLLKHKDCVKGYYKRAKAHAAIWNEKEARRDFNMVSQLDVTLASLVHRELRALSECMKEKYCEEKETYWNMLERIDKTVLEEEQVEIKGTRDDSEDGTTVCKGHGEDSSESRKPEVPPERTEEDASCSEVHPLNTSSKPEGKDWQKMLRIIMLLQKEGNFLIQEKRFEDASVKFKEMVEYVDDLQEMVDPEAEDWETLERVRLPLTLNLSQCLLELHQNQQVVDLNNKLLEKHKGNFKALYQRARAHAALCNEDEARRDFDMVEKLDPKFKQFVRQELKKLGDSMRAVHAHQKKTYWDTTQERWGSAGSKMKGGARKKRGEKPEEDDSLEEPTSADAERGDETESSLEDRHDHLASDKEKARVTTSTDEEKDHVTTSTAEDKDHVTTSTDEEKGHVTTSTDEDKDHVTTSTDEEKGHVTTSTDEEKDDVTKSTDEEKDDVTKSTDEEKDLGTTSKD